MIVLTHAKALANYTVQLSFNDGVVGVVDLSYLLDKEVFYSWNDYGVFQNLSIDEETNALTWPGQIDLDTLNLYCKVTNKNPEKIWDAKN